MEIYSVGPDSCHKYLDVKDVPDGCKWVVYHYVEGSYEGNGIAVAYCDNGRMYKKELGHCSCFGPWDEPNWEEISVDDLKNKPYNALHYSFPDELIAHVLELLSEEE